VFFFPIFTGTGTRRISSIKDDTQTTSEPQREVIHKETLGTTLVEIGTCFLKQRIDGELEL